VLRNEILKVVDNETVRQFWFQDYEGYRKDDLGPPRNKLSKLLVSGTVSLMLSQPESRINFRQIMNDGMILLVNLSGIGSMIRGILGSFILSLFHATALCRSVIPEPDRKQFHIHCDEAHRFITGGLEELISETRKYGVSLSLAHQFLDQFDKRKIGAIASVGSTITFNVQRDDARRLTKDLQKKVSEEDLTSLEVGHAIVRLGTDIVRLKTQRPLPIPSQNFRDRIIRESQEKYCMPAYEVRKLIRDRASRWCTHYTPLVPLQSEMKGNDLEELVYEEF
jgi:hypothetical protein